VGVKEKDALLRFLPSRANVGRGISGVQCFPPAVSPSSIMARPANALSGATTLTSAASASSLSSLSRAAAFLSLYFLRSVGGGGARGRRRRRPGE